MWIFLAVQPHQNPSLTQVAVKRLASQSVCLLVLASTGCETVRPCHEGQQIAEHWPGGGVKAAPAPYAAKYLLFWHEDGVERPAGADKNPSRTVVTLSRSVEENESVGFRRDERGGLVAVAGNDSIAIPEGRYCWHISPETEHGPLRRAAVKTRKTAVIIAQVPFFIACLPIFLILPVAGGAK